MLFVRTTGASSALSLAVTDGCFLELSGKKWRANVVESGLDLTLLVTKDNKFEQAKQRRLDVKNEIEKRTAEVDALQSDHETILAQIKQVLSLILSLSHSSF